MAIYKQEEKEYLKDLSEMERVFLACEKKDAFIGFSAAAGDTILSAIAGYKWFNRLHLLAVFNTDEGFSSGAYPTLVDDLIRQSCSSATELDFMGSMVDEIHDFNRRFGAKEEIYYSYQLANPLLATMKKAIGR